MQKVHLQADVVIYMLGQQYLQVNIDMRVPEYQHLRENVDIGMSE